MYYNRNYMINKIKLLMLYSIITNKDASLVDWIIKPFKLAKENPIKTTTAFVGTIIFFYGYKIKTEFEKEYLVLPKDVELSFVSKSFNELLNLVGLGNKYYFEKVIGTVLRGNKSGNYRDEQYAKLKISEAIRGNLDAELKNEFLDKVFFENVCVNDKICNFTLNIENISSTLLAAIKASVGFFSNTKLDINTLSGEYKLSDTIENKTLYSLLIPNNGTRVNKEKQHDTKCPVMSLEYDMLYRINIFYKNRLDTDSTFKKELFTSINEFNKFLQKIKTLNHIGDFFKHDVNYLNKNSYSLSKNIGDVLSTQQIEEKDGSIEEMSKLVAEVGNNLHQLIAQNNTSDNVFKHINIPFMIQKLISEFNVHKNKDGLKLPNLQFNAPYLTNNFWCVLDPNEQNQNIQIAINAGHLENRYYFFSKEERDNVKKTMLEVLKKYIPEDQFKYIEQNIKEDDYRY